MDDQTRKKYAAVKIPETRENTKKAEDPAPLEAPERKRDVFYELEYDESPPGRKEKILRVYLAEKTDRDVRERFEKMWDIGRDIGSSVRWNSPSLLEVQTQKERAKIFYRQGRFMTDFEDHYGGFSECTSPSPLYEKMTYSQLRTYFTWRTRVRAGEVKDTSLAYAYLYVYELLNNIGLENPQEGLDALMFFWVRFRNFHPEMTETMNRWLKDYHIFYDMMPGFEDFVKKYHLEGAYPEGDSPSDSFDSACDLSKYDVRCSRFYTPENEPLIRNCYNYLIISLRLAFASAGLNFNRILCYESGAMSVWTPFQGAPFFPRTRQRNRVVTISDTEVYECYQNNWKHHTETISQKGRNLLTYCLKKMESEIRAQTRYPYTLKVNASLIDVSLSATLKKKDIRLDQIIADAVDEFCQKAWRPVMQVDTKSLDQIREDSRIIQEKLTVEEEEIPVPVKPQKEEKPAPKPVSMENTDPWAVFKASLSPLEMGALRALSRGEKSLEAYAAGQGVMAEVLSDGINDKAVDALGDQVLDGEFVIYEDYAEQVKEMVSER